MPSMKFTDLAVQKLKPPKGRAQASYFQTLDGGGRALMLVVGSRTKTWRCLTYTETGKAKSIKIGRYPDMTVAEARKRVNDLADNPAKAKAAADKTTFEAVVDKFIELYAKPRQRTWKQTERALKVHCADWLKKPFTSITKNQAQDLLDGFLAEGHGPKGRITLAWLRTLWDWAWKRDLVPSPIMQQVEIEYEKRSRERLFTDDEVKAIWQAAETLDPTERDYIKLLVLLGQRKSALARMQRSELHDAEKPTIWTTPNENTKSSKRSKKRAYLTPLPALAVRIFKGLPKEGLLFPSSKDEKICIWPGSPLTKKPIEAGAPKDFTYHAVRHKLATWFENRGYSEFERGLILNHSGSGVTAGYSHGYPIELKRKLLEKWEAHVEMLVAPKGAALLR